MSRQISLGVDHDFTFNGFRGTISPTLNLRDNITARSVTQADISPAISINLRKGAHSLALSHNSQLQDIKSITGIDTDTHQSALNYSYTRKAHRFEIQANYFGRNPDPGEDTDAYRIGIGWTYNFDRPARPVQQPAQQVLAATEDQGDTQTPKSFIGAPDMINLAPGMKIDVVRARLESSGIVQPLVRGNLEIYETPFIEEIDHRQRLGLLSSGGFLDQSVLAIEFDDLGDIDSTLQIYEEVRKILFDRYGAPLNRIEEGEFTANLNDDLRSGRFRRIIEWQTNAGILRFGIPYRTDGQIRMELIHASSFSSGENNFWSTEPLR